MVAQWRWICAWHCSVPSAVGRASWRNSAIVAEMISIWLSSDDCWPRCTTVWWTWTAAAKEERVEQSNERESWASTTTMLAVLHSSAVVSATSESSSRSPSPVPWLRRRHSSAASNGRISAFVVSPASYTDHKEYSFAYYCSYSNASTSEW